jgi:hypothetical protein
MPNWLLCLAPLSPSQKCNIPEIETEQNRKPFQTRLTKEKNNCLFVNSCNYFICYILAFSLKNYISLILH